MFDTGDQQENVFRVPTEEGVSASSSHTPAGVERLSDRLQQTIQTLTGAHRQPPRRFKSLLNGTWMGHPLHPALTDVPVGSWMLATLFDLLWLILPVSFIWAARTAEILVCIGLLGAVGAAVTGLTDWSDTYGSERTTGLYHGLLNMTATVLYLMSLLLRLLSASGESRSAAVIGFVGFAVLLFAAKLGGDLVFIKGTGVNHTAWEAGSDEYEAVLPLEQVEENKLYRVSVAGVPVIVLRQGLQLSAISATCPHAGGPLDEGTLTGDVVACPWHGSRFCLRTGRVLTGPATVNAPRYHVRVRDGQVELKRAGEQEETHT